MPSSAQHSVGVAAVVLNDAGNVFITQRRDNGHWEPPGGSWNSKSILEEARREVRAGGRR